MGLHYFDVVHIAILQIFLASVHPAGLGPIVYKIRQVPPYFIQSFSIFHDQRRVDTDSQPVQARHIENGHRPETAPASRKCQPSYQSSSIHILTWLR